MTFHGVYGIIDKSFMIRIVWFILATCHYLLCCEIAGRRALKLHWHERLWSSVIEQSTSFADYWNANIEKMHKNDK